MYFIPQKRYNFVTQRTVEEEKALINIIFDEYDANTDNVIDY